MTRTFHNLSPSPERVGRACVWVEYDGRVLMSGLEWGGWTLPGGGIHPGETGVEAAVREAWEEAGVHAEPMGQEPFTIYGRTGIESQCYALRLVSLAPSPEGRPVAWINPFSLPWADDFQVRQVLACRGLTPLHLEVPPLVARAQEKARELEFERSCSLETGRLLRMLAASRPGGRLLELGTGVGVGAAWMLSGMGETAHLLTVENNESRAKAAWELLRGDLRVTTLYGDWQDTLTHGPFDLIFSDCAPSKRETAHLNTLVTALKVGGMLVVDNFSPVTHLPEALHAGDAERDALFSHPPLTCTEIQVNHAERVILATRTK